MENAKEFCGIRLVSAVINGASSEDMRTMADKARESGENTVAVIGGVNDKGTVSFAVACGKEAVRLGVHAGNLVRSIAQAAGGSGGGRPESAMAGAKDTEKVEIAINSAESLIKESLN
jgi:alanyl-tRNA synthetase